MGTDELIYKSEIESQMQQTNMIMREEMGKGVNWDIGTDIYTLPYIKQITNKDLLYNIGNYSQYSVMTYMGKESKKE